VGDVSDMTERMAEKFWNAFRDGYIAAARQSGAKGTDYPTWKQSNDPVKDETRRCMRHAVEELKTLYPNTFATTFPGKPERRKLKMSANDAMLRTSLKLGEIGK
jgi:hypothetical protein